MNARFDVVSWSPDGRRPPPLQPPGILDRPERRRRAHAGRRVDRLGRDASLCAGGVECGRTLARLHREQPLGVGAGDRALRPRRRQLARPHARRATVQRRATVAARRLMVYASADGNRPLDLYAAGVATAGRPSPHRRQSAVGLQGDGEDAADHLSRRRRRDAPRASPISPPTFARGRAIRRCSTSTRSSSTTPSTRRSTSSRRTATSSSSHRSASRPASRGRRGRKGSPRRPTRSSTPGSPTRRASASSGRATAAMPPTS